MSPISLLAPELQTRSKLQLDPATVNHVPEEQMKELKRDWRGNDKSPKSREEIFEKGIDGSTGCCREDRESKEGEERVGSQEDKGTVRSGGKKFRSHPHGFGFKNDWGKLDRQDHEGED